MRRGIVGSLIALAGAVALGSVAAWYTVQDRTYVTTDYAWVYAPATIVQSPALGTVSSAPALPGRFIRRGQVVFGVHSPRGDTIQAIAPVSGTVGPLRPWPGSSVQAGQDLLWIVQLDRSEVVAEIPETFANRVKVGQSADVTLAADRADTLQGSVTAIGRETLGSSSPLLAEDPFAKEVQWITVWIRLHASGWHPRAGESAVVRIDAPAQGGS